MARQVATETGFRTCSKVSLSEDDSCDSYSYSASESEYPSEDVIREQVETVASERSDDINLRASASTHQQGNTCLPKHTRPNASELGANKHGQRSVLIRNVPSPVDSESESEYSYEDDIEEKARAPLSERCHGRAGQVVIQAHGQTVTSERNGDLNRPVVLRANANCLAKQRAPMMAAKKPRQ